MFSFITLTSSCFLFVTILAFSDDFIYFDKLYSLSSHFNLSLAVNVTLLNNQLSQTLLQYFVTYDLLHKVRNIIQAETLNLPPYSFHLHGFLEPLEYSYNTCKSLPYSCSLPTFNSFSDIDKLKSTVKTINIPEVHTGYIVTNTGHIFHNNIRLNSSHFLMDQNVENPLCSLDFIPAKDKCIHAQNIFQTTYYLAVDYCRMIHSTLLYLLNEDDSEIAENVFLTKNFHYFWIGGTYSDSEYPDLPFCFGADHTKPHIVYDVKFRCFDRVNSNFMAQPSCQQTLRIQLEKISSLRNLRFPSQAEKFPLSFTNSGNFYLSSASRRLPTLCNCSFDLNLTHLLHSSQAQLIAKLNTTMQSLSSITFHKFRRVFLHPYTVKTELHNKLFLDIYKANFHLRYHEALLNITTSLDYQSLFSDYFHFAFNLSQFHSFNNPIFTPREPMFSPQTFSDILQQCNNLLLTLENMPLSVPHMELTHYHINYDKAQVMSYLSMIQVNHLAIIALIDNIYISYDDLLVPIFYNIQSLEELIQNTFSSSLPTSAALRQILDIAYVHLPSGYSFLQDKVLDIFKTATISTSFDNSMLMAHFQLPITKSNDMMMLYKMKPKPYFIPKMGFVIPEYESSILGVTADHAFSHINASDLLSCTYIKGYLCNSINLLHKSSKSCMISHFLRRTYEASNTCNYQTVVAPYFHFSETGILYYFVPYITETVLLCVNKKQFDFIFQIGNIVVPKGCSLSLNDSIIFENPFTNFTVLTNFSLSRENLQLATPDVFVPTILSILTRIGTFSTFTILSFIVVVIVFIILTIEIVLMNESFGTKF